MKSQGASMLIWAAALIIPLLIFIVIGDNLNERQPVLPFIVCPLLTVGAARATAKLSLSFLVWAAVAGLVYAAILVFAA